MADLYADNDGFLASPQDSLYYLNDLQDAGFVSSLGDPIRDDAVAKTLANLDELEFGVPGSSAGVPDTAPPWAPSQELYDTMVRQSVALNQFPQLVDLNDALRLIQAAVQAQEWEIVKRMSQNRLWQALYFRDFVVGVHSQRIFEILSSAEKWKQYETLMMAILPWWRLVPSVSSGGLQRGRDPVTGAYDTEPVRLVDPPPVPRDETTLWKALYEMRGMLITRRLREERGQFKPVMVRALKAQTFQMNSNMFIVTVDLASRKIKTLVKAPSIDTQVESVRPLNARIRDEQVKRAFLNGPYLLIPQLRMGDTWALGMIQIVSGSGGDTSNDARKLSTNLMVFDSDLDPFDLSLRYENDPEMLPLVNMGTMKQSIQNDYMLVTYLGPTASQARAQTEELSSEELAVGTRRRPLAQSGDLNLYSFFSLRDLSWTSDTRGRVQVFDMGQSVVAGNSFFVVEYNLWKRI